MPHWVYECVDEPVEGKRSWCVPPHTVRGMKPKSTLQYICGVLPDLVSEAEEEGEDAPWYRCMRLYHEFVRISQYTYPLTRLSGTVAPPHPMVLLLWDLTRRCEAVASANLAQGTFDVTRHVVRVQHSILMDSDGAYVSQIVGFVQTSQDQYVRCFALVYTHGHSLEVIVYSDDWVGHVLTASARRDEELGQCPWIQSLLAHLPGVQLTLSCGTRHLHVHDTHAYFHLSQTHPMTRSPFPPTHPLSSPTRSSSSSTAPVFSRWHYAGPAASLEACWTTLTESCAWLQPPSGFVARWTVCVSGCDEFRDWCVDYVEVLEQTAHRGEVWVNSVRVATERTHFAYGYHFMCPAAQRPDMARVVCKVRARHLAAVWHGVVALERDLDQVFRDCSERMLPGTLEFAAFGRRHICERVRARTASVRLGPIREAVPVDSWTVPVRRKRKRVTQEHNASDRDTGLPKDGGFHAIMAFDLVEVDDDGNTPQLGVRDRRLQAVPTNMTRRTQRFEMNFATLAQRTAAGIPRWRLVQPAFYDFRPPFAMLQDSAGNLFCATEPPNQSVALMCDDTHLPLGCNASPGAIEAVMIDATTCHVVGDGGASGRWVVRALELLETHGLLRPRFRQWSLWTQLILFFRAWEPHISQTEWDEVVTLRELEPSSDIGLGQLFARAGDCVHRCVSCCVILAHFGFQTRVLFTLEQHVVLAVRTLKHGWRQVDLGGG